MTTALNVTYWYFNVGANAGAITYSNGSSGSPAATSLVIIDTTQPLVGVRNQSKITMVNHYAASGDDHDITQNIV